VCCGYKGYVIKEYFANYFLHMSDVTFDMQHNQMEVHERHAEPWRVTLVDTGDNTMTGGRLKRVAQYVKDEEAFCFTYGDGVSDVDISALVAFHKQHGKNSTVTAVQPPGRYGALKMEGESVRGFIEKPLGDGGWINGGFFVLSPACLDLIDDDRTAWEGAPLAKLAAQGELLAYKHKGFWQPMDTLRDKNQLEELWQNNRAPWKSWK
jgi:glucose-1-phosphate cytidylyltransferase